MGGFVIQTRNLSKKFKSQYAVNSLNMSVKKGDIYGLIGKNGAGKTTFIRLIMGLIYPTEGEIAMWGESSETALLEGRKRVGSIIETPAFHPNMNAKQNLEMVRLQRGIQGKDCIDRCLKDVGLEDTGSKKASRFSLGMKQRLAIGAALISDPEMLILDEPVNGLDPIGIVEIRELLKKINRERGVTILISSHILSEVYQMATCYGIMHKGELIEELTMYELNNKSRKYLQITVDDASKAAVVIEREFGTTNFEILPGSKIHLYDRTDNPGEVNRILNTNRIVVESIQLMGEDLEAYFLKSVGGTGNV
ncbi:ATP-binding cassette domain-containing protein [Oscillospiraceae bacterium CM]|nr:ATP-binding cassette domain-containing protein [Oscillospiraceae bacterium CM]